MDNQTWVAMILTDKGINQTQVATILMDNQTWVAMILTDEDINQTQVAMILTDIVNKQTLVAMILINKVDKQAQVVTILTDKSTRRQVDEGGGITDKVFPVRGMTTRQEYGKRGDCR